MVRRQLSNRGLARLLLPEGADKAAVDSKRAQVAKWRTGPRGFSDETAIAIARVTGQPDTYLMKGGRTLTLAEELADFRRDFRQEYHDDMQRLRNELRQDVRKVVREELRRGA